MAAWYIRRAAGACYALAVLAVLQGHASLFVLACAAAAAICHIRYGTSPCRRRTTRRD